MTIQRLLAFAALGNNSACGSIEHRGRHAVIAAPRQRGCKITVSEPCLASPLAELCSPGGSVKLKQEQAAWSALHGPRGKEWQG